MNRILHRLLNKFYKPLYAPILGATLKALFGALGVIFYFAFGSLIYLFVGLVALIDLVNSIFIYFAVKQSIRNAEIAFNYGGGKYESLAVLWSFFALSHLAYKSIILFDEFKISQSNFLPLYAFLFISALAFYLLQKLQYESARHNNLSLISSEAFLLGSKYFLEAIPFLLLLISEFSAKFIFITSTFNSAFIAVFALIAALFIKSFVQVKSAFKQLMDKPLPENMQFELLAVITENIDKFCQFKAFHTRSSGKDIFIEIDIVMPWDFTVEDTYKVEMILIKQILEKFPNSLPRVYVFPCRKDCIYEDKINCPIKNRIKNAI